MLRIAPQLLAGALVALAPAAPASAKIFTVDEPEDAVDDNPGDGVCQGTYFEIGSSKFGCFLRAAVDEANALAGPDVIEIPDGTYLLGIPGAGENGADTGDLDVTDELTIRPVDPSGGPEGVILDGDGLDRVFDVRVGSELAIEDLTLRGGLAPSGAGGVRNDGRLALRRCVVRENEGTTAGGVDSLQGAELVVEDGTFAENHASAGAGAIRSFRADLLLRRSTLRHNTGSDAGALLHVSSQTGFGTAVLVNSTVTKNDGPAIRVEGNEAVTELYNTTVAENGGVGLSGQSTSPSVRLENTVLAQNQGVDCTAPVLSGFENAFGTTGGDCAPAPPGDVTGVGTVLAGLADYGGPTWTHRPLEGSALVDGGTPPGEGGCLWRDLAGDPFALLVDQRCEARPIDGDEDGSAVCDVGAVEFLPAPGGGARGAAALAALAALARVGCRFSPRPSSV